MDFQHLANNEKIRAYIQESMDRGIDFFEAMETINRINNEKKLALINEVIEERKKDYGYPPSSYCWFEMGSAGRMEQLYRSDQDNGLVFDSGKDQEENKGIEAYYTGFSHAVNLRFKDWGFEFCPGQVMANNELWRGSVDEWARRIEHWIRVPKASNVRIMTIFLDFAPLAGQLSLGSNLREHMHETVRRNPLFLRFLAEDAWSGTVAKIGEPMDVKTGLLVHLVDGIRLFAIRHGCRNPSTRKRLDFLEEKGVFSVEFSQELRESLEYVMLKKLRYEHSAWDPSSGSKDEREQLIEVLQSIRTLKGIIHEEFLPTI